MFRNLVSKYDEELLATRPIPKLEDKPLSAVRNFSFNIFAATVYIGGHSSSRNQNTHLAVVNATQ
jgi:hypothetical protein